MRGRLGWVVGVGLLGGFGPPAFAIDPHLGQCTKTFETDASGYLLLSTNPAKLCSLDCLARSASGWAAAWDSPTQDGTHADTTDQQAVVVAEKGSASAGDSTGTGETARYTDFGLLIETSGCLATGSWQD